MATQTTFSSKRSMRQARALPDETGPVLLGRSVLMYAAHCHCNTVQFSVLVPALGSRAHPSAAFGRGNAERKPVVQCNCSVCTAHGLIMTHCPRNGVIFVQGEDQLTGYFCGGRTREFRFCRHCGTAVLFDLKPEDRRDPAKCEQEWVGVNVRTFEGVDVEDLEKIQFDGRGVKT